ncbi:MAG: 50S ribosomal protein L16 [bacterium]|nr:50S ribosomal protein L16 [bacterium]
MLQPKKSKYRKQFRTGAKVASLRGSTLCFGEYGLKSLTGGWLSGNQIESARRTITHFTKRGGKVWIRPFPDKPVTSKGLGVGMGAGKGDIKGYVAVITPGRILFEIAGVPREIGHEALMRASHKLPFKTRVVSKE